MVNKPPRYDLCHNLIRAVRPLAALKAERERERADEVFCGCGRQFVGSFGHRLTIERSAEPNKNKARCARETAHYAPPKVDLIIINDFSLLWWWSQTESNRRPLQCH